jgi:hypothetical protein
MPRRAAKMAASVGNKTEILVRLRPMMGKQSRSSQIW